MLIAGIGHLLRTGICTLQEAWRLASERPADIMRLNGLGRLQIGAIADAVTFDVSGGRLTVRDVVKAGHKVIASSGSA
jgi:N-acetylglucosamine-6-phosphate deacetylase